MQVVYKNNIDENRTVAIARVEDFSQAVLDEYVNHRKGVKILDDFGHDKELETRISNVKRRIQWFTVRHLIAQLLDLEQIRIIKNEHGKPFVENEKIHLSISHSGLFVAVALSKQNECGIDIEEISPKIDRIKHRFMRDKEMNSLNAEDKIDELYIYWTAKEALYKFYWKKQLNFKNHILIEPFKYERQGLIIGHIFKHEPLKKYKIYYETIDEHMMSYTFGV